MKKLCVLTVIIALFGMMIPLVLYGNFIVFGDFAIQQIPFIMETKRMLSSGAPLWSWNDVFGDNFIGGYSFYTVTSPFVWLNCLFPYEHILTGITLTLLLKFLCLSCFTYLYLRKMGISKPYCVVGGLLYAFSSFAIINLAYYHFLEPMMCFPLLLLAIEKYLRRERYSGLLLGLAAFLVTFINFYFALSSLICALIYVIFRVRADDVHIGTKGIVTGVAIILAGVGMSFFVLLPTICHMMGNPGASINWNLKLLTPFNIFERFRTLFYPKIYEGINTLIRGAGFGSNAANIAVIGVLCAALYCTRYKDWLKWVVITCLVIYLTPLNGLFCGLTRPTYSRWAYALTMFLVLASMRYLDRGNKITMRAVGVYGLVALSSVVMVYALRFAFPILEVEEVDIVFNVCAFLLGVLSFCFLLYYVKHQNVRVLTVCVALFVVIHMQVFFFKFSALNPYNNSPVETYILNNKLERVADDATFTYRTDIATRPHSNAYTNMGMLKNRADIRSFISTPNSKVHNLIVAADATHFHMRMHPNPNKHLREFDALMSVKDIIVYEPWLQQDEPRTWGVNKRSGSGYDIMENKYYIPMGFTYDHYIGEAKINEVLLNDSVNVPMQLLANLAVKSEDIPFVSQYLKEGHLVGDVPIDSVVAERRKVVCSSFAGDTRGFTASVDMDRDNLLFFSVPCDDGFSASVDGKPTRIYEANLGLSAVFVNAGKHDIQFSFFPRGMKAGIVVSVLCLVLLLLMSWLTSRERAKR